MAYYYFLLSKGWQRKGKTLLFILSLPLISFVVHSTRVVPENILKKQARDAKLLKALKESREKAKKERAEARKAALANAEKYHKEYTAHDEAIIKAKRDARAKNAFYVEAEPKVAFIVRIKG
jgi:large subunit ribosomal protein L7e